MQRNEVQRIGTALLSSCIFVSCDLLSDSSFSMNSIFARLPPDYLIYCSRQGSAHSPHDRLRLGLTLPFIECYQTSRNEEDSALSPSHHPV